MMRSGWGWGKQRNGTGERRSNVSLAIVFLTNLEFKKSNQIRIYVRKCQETQKDKYNAYFYQGKKHSTNKVFHLLSTV